MRAVVLRCDHGFSFPVACVPQPDRVERLLRRSIFRRPGKPVALKLVMRTLGRDFDRLDLTIEVELQVREPKLVCETMLRERNAHVAR